MYLFFVVRELGNRGPWATLTYCFYMVCELRVIFTFLNGEKNKKTIWQRENYIKLYFQCPLGGFYRNAAHPSVCTWPVAAFMLQQQR